MTLKAICECWTCGECANAPGRSGYCLNCEATDSGAEGSHAQPEKNPNDHDRPHRFDVPGGMVGECLFWGCTERNPEEKITPAMHRAAPAMLEALRAAHKHAHKALTAESNSYTDEANMLDVLAVAIAAAEGGAAKHVHSFSIWHDRQDRPARGYSRCACGVEPGDDWAEGAGDTQS